MKNIVHCLTLALAILALVVSGCAQKVNVEAERATLRNADAEWSKVAAAKDVDGYVAAVGENGSILPPNTPILTGNEAIRQSASEMMANPGFALGWKPTTVEVSTAGDLGYIVGTYESTLQDVQGNLVTDRGKYVTVWKKQPDGKWKVAADIFNSDLPAPTAGLSESDETAIRQPLQELSAAADDAADVIAAELAVVAALNAGDGSDNPAARAVTPEETTGFITVDGFKLRYHIEGTGVPCMVVGDALTPARALSKELRKHFRFIFMDSRMTVQCDKSVEIEKITMDTLIDDVEQVRKALGLNKICVLGHSISGLLALEYARKYPEHASYVIMHGTPPYYNTKFKEIVAENWEVHASDERKRILKQNWEKLPKDTLSSLSPSDADILKYITDGPKIWYDPTYDASWLLKGAYWNVEVWNHLFEVIMAKYDLTKEDKIKTPVFLALGRYDFLVPYYVWNKFKDKFPYISYNLFEKSGHYPMFEEQELFDKKLIEWIKSH